MRWVLPIILCLVPTLACARSVTSPPMMVSNAAVRLTLDLSGMEYLELKAFSEKPMYAAIWGEGVLTLADGSTTNLADLKPDNIKAGRLTIRSKPAGRKFTVDEREFDHYLYGPVPHGVFYNLDKKYKSIEVWVGREAASKAWPQLGITFEVSDPGDIVLNERIRAAQRTLSKDNLAGLRTVLERRSGARDQLKKLERYEAQFDAITEKIVAGEEDGLKQAAQFELFIKDVYAADLDAPLLFVKRQPYMSAHIYDEYIPTRPGGGIYILENPLAAPEDQIVRALIDPATEETLGEGVYRDPELSYDTKRVLFAFKGVGSQSTSIYEIGINGQGLRRLTDTDKVWACTKPEPGLHGQGHHDVTPAYLPDDRIAFTSTRQGGHVMCFSSYIDTLHTMNSDGSDMQCISVNNQNEFDPTVMHDGRVLYGRWEYVDKTALYMQSLWTVNPDGSDETAFFANNMAKPTALLDARPVPNSRLVVAALTPHNGQSVGAIAMIDQSKGKNSLDALTNFTPEFDTEMDQGVTYGPSDPWPLNEDLVLIANNDRKHGKHGVIELVSREGVRIVMRREDDLSCYAPMLVKPRKKPAVRPSMIRPGEPGKFLVHDIYQGMDGVERGEVKWIRVLESTSRVSGIPSGGRWWNQAFLVSWQGSYDIKRFFGLVPVEEDGSAFFEAPTGKALYFQALDKDKKLIQSQRTFVQSVAGVTRSCQGCHIKEDNVAPANTAGRPIAVQKPAAKIQHESWGSGFLDYPTMVQPVLDKNCVSCHGGEKGIKGGIDLSGGWTYAFNISYETFIRNTLVGFLNCHNGNVRTAEILDPRMHGSGEAPLADLLLSGHPASSETSAGTSKGRLEGMTQAEKELLLAWMDGNCNYYGSWDYSTNATCKAILETEDKLIAEMKTANCMSCHQEKIGNDWVNVRGPEKSRILRAPMAKGKGLGLGWCKQEKAPAVVFELINPNWGPPDVFRHLRKTAPKTEGEVVSTFANTDHASYQAMLKIIENAKADALKTPRVDMPGAEIIEGRCRELTPIAPPTVEPILHGIE